MQIALGPQVMNAIAASRTAAVGVADLETAVNIADGTRAALRELVGTASSGGRLQVWRAREPKYGFCSWRDGGRRFMCEDVSCIMTNATK